MRKHIVINPHTKINMIVLTEEEVEHIRSIVDRLKKGCDQCTKEFQDKYGIPPRNVLSFGDTSSVSVTLLNKIIPKHNYTSAPRPKIGSFHCYVVHDPTIVLHEDVFSSWNCLMHSASNPKFILIFSKN